MTKNNSTTTTTNKDNNTNNRILLVDDEPDITTAFTLGLEDNGFKVDAFNDPVKALSDFRRDSYDLAILDYKMPKMNGFELYREIRKIGTKLRYALLQRLKCIMKNSERSFRIVLIYREKININRT
jgi:DNA-binding response OmpR family regulator